jgi:hypothetical protein
MEFFLKVYYIMPRKSKRSLKKSNKLSKTRKQKVYVMRGCSKKTKSCKNNKNNKNNKKILTLGNKGCPNCGPNCHCGPNCNCPHPCPGTCYLNRRLKGGSAGCGSCGCPYAPLSIKQMNMFGGATTDISPPNNILPPNNISPPNNIPPPNNILPATVPLNYNPILGTGQNGGSCSSCGGQTSTVPLNYKPIPGTGQNRGLCPYCGAQTSTNQSGGNFFKPAGPIPGPIVGSSWGAPIDKWPGVNGISSDRNFLKSYDAENNIVAKNPQLQMITGDSGYRNWNSITGGRRKSGRPKSRSKSVKGGGLIPQDLVNLGSDFSFNLKSAYNSLNGYKAPVDPLPYKDQLSHSLNNNRNLL